MLKAVRVDLEAVADIMQHIAKMIGKMQPKERVDLCARLRSVEKSAELLVKDLKGEIRIALKGQAGTLAGEAFKARLQFIPMPRLDQQKLKSKFPDAYADCVTTEFEPRITFEAR